ATGPVAGQSVLPHAGDGTGFHAQAERRYAPAQPPEYLEGKAHAGMVARVAFDMGTIGKYLATEGFVEDFYASRLPSCGIGQKSEAQRCEKHSVGLRDIPIAPAFQVSHQVVELGSDGVQDF